MKKIRTFLALGPATVFGISLLAVPFISSAATLYRQLDLGMSGSDVSDLQTFLAADPSIYPQGLVTGYYGSLTQAAVSKFQARNGISSVGRVGPVTMTAINSQMGGAVSLDTNAPLITGPTLSNNGSNMIVTWTTNEPAAGLVYYSQNPITMIEASANTGITISGTAAIADLAPSYNHSATLTGLTSNSSYNFALYSRDASGNVTVTLPSTLRTN
jgi:peptidoglycan hydrolase-like protein with peptidoglycan-binding domain